MKYFAKFLPVEGDKKTATHLLYKGEVYEHLSLLNNKDREIYTFIMKSGDKKGYHERWEDLTSVKMFLCSRDITKSNFVIQEGNQRDLYNIIGEISPDAIWVKEGDHFDEDQIKPTGRGERTHTKENNNGTFDVTYEFRQIFKIKGPCGHFH